MQDKATQNLCKSLSKEKDINQLLALAVFFFIYNEE